MKYSLPNPHQGPHTHSPTWTYKPAGLVTHARKLHLMPQGPGPCLLQPGAHLRSAHEKCDVSTQQVFYSFVLFVFICVCTYIYIYIYLFIYLFMYVRKYVICIHACMHECMHACMHDACMQTYMHTRRYINLKVGWHDMMVPHTCMYVCK